MPAKPSFAPAIGPRRRLRVRKVIPAVAVVAVILAHRAPLPLAEVGPPRQPILFTLPVFVQSLMLGTGTGGQIFTCFRRAKHTPVRALVGADTSA